MSESVELVERQDGIFAIARFLGTGECAALIAQSERVGYEAASITTGRGTQIDSGVRNNARVIADDPARASALWGRIRDLIPQFYLGRQAVGINERFRFYRYNPGERFAGHIDSPYRRDNGEQSLLTFMIYLNDDFDGGETAFPDLVVRPATGLALLFRHDIFHEGRPVGRGRKYVLRSDVMFNPPGRITRG